MTPDQRKVKQRSNPSAWAWRVTAAVCVAAVAAAITVVGSSERASLGVAAPVGEEFAASEQSVDESPPTVQEPDDELSFSYELGLEDESASNPPATFSYQASLELAGSHVCGGTLIGSQYVLTAASCVRGVSEGQLQVRLGAQNQLATQTELLAVDRRVLHPDAGIGYGPDLAVVRLVEPANPIFVPAALAIGEASGLGQSSEVQLSGWGQPHLSTRATGETFASGRGRLESGSEACGEIGDLLETEVACVGHDGGEELCLATDLGGAVIAGGPQPSVVGTVGYGNRCDGLLVATPTEGHLNWILEVLDDPFAGFDSE